MNTRPSQSRCIGGILACTSELRARRQATGLSVRVVSLRAFTIRCMVPVLEMTLRYRPARGVAPGMWVRGLASPALLPLGFLPGVVRELHSQGILKAPKLEALLTRGDDPMAPFEGEGAELTTVPETLKDSAGVARGHAGRKEMELTMSSEAVRREDGRGPRETRATGAQSKVALRVFTRRCMVPVLGMTLRYRPARGVAPGMWVRGLASPVLLPWGFLPGVVRDPHSRGILKAPKLEALLTRIDDPLAPFLSPKMGVTPNDHVPSVVVKNSGEGTLAVVVNPVEGCSAELVRFGVPDCSGRVALRDGALPAFSEPVSLFFILYSERLSLLYHPRLEACGLPWRRHQVRSEPRLRRSPQTKVVVGRMSPCSFGFAAPDARGSSHPFVVSVSTLHSSSMVHKTEFSVCLVTVTMLQQVTFVPGYPYYVAIGARPKRSKTGCSSGPPVSGRPAALGAEPRAARHHTGRHFFLPGDGLDPGSEPEEDLIENAECLGSSTSGEEQARKIKTSRLADQEIRCIIPGRRFRRVGDVAPPQTSRPSCAASSPVPPPIRSRAPDYGTLPSRLCVVST
ncbi:hypothetical protein HPB47_018560 [Ixodes persulcatus]|uniref:Uncharacterized protein n=1 Tax=Ixodes persulcatus TaxID=34615 RepID=A0AC60QKE3_IXOPE|nr:hypothetical protein HPB47_018560 [Ixodes persulcatus]